MIMYESLTLQSSFINMRYTIMTIEKYLTKVSGVIINQIKCLIFI